MNMNTGLLILFVVLLVLYLMRRRSRMRAEDQF
jgi:hypothetical protein